MNNGAARRQPAAEAPVRGIFHPAAAAAWHAARVVRQRRCRGTVCRRRYGSSRCGHRFRSLLF